MNPHTQPLELKLQPSRCQQALIVATHGAVLGVAAALALERPAVALLIPVCVASGTRQLWRARLLASTGISGLVLMPHGECIATTRVGQRLSGELRRSAAYGAGLVYLAIAVPTATGAGTRRLLVWRDAVDDDAHRRLRARARLA